MFWGWVVEIGLRVKNRELAQGLDKDGKKLKPIKAKTRKYRRSAMTLTKGRALSGPPLMPARELSRTRSLLAGRATEDAAVFYWRFDPFVGDSWGVILAYQAKKGRDVVGLSAEGVARVRAEAWERWRLYKAGRYQPAKPIPTVSAAIPQTGTYGMQHATLGIGATSMPQFKPGRSTGGRTWLQIRRELVEPNPTPVAPPGRKPGPYNRYLANVWGQRGAAGQATVKPPKPPAPKPPAPAAPPVAAITMPPSRADVHFTRLEVYAQSQGHALHRASPELLAELQYTETERANVPLFYLPRDKRIYLNPEATLWKWKDPTHAIRDTADVRWWVARTPESLIDHEIGHAKHHESIGYAMNFPDFREAFDAETAAKIAELVSQYASMNRGEFVAEVYTGLKAAIKYPQSVLDYYRDLGGVLP